MTKSPCGSDAGGSSYSVSVGQTEFTDFLTLLLSTVYIRKLNRDPQVLLMILEKFMNAYMFQF